MHEQLKLSVSGHITLWARHKETGEERVLIDQPNLVLKLGAEMMAKSLQGNRDFNIWGIQFGFYNGQGDFTSPEIDVDYSFPLSGYTAPFGNVKIPLLTPASFSGSTGYTDNVAAYQATLVSGDQVDPVGAPLTGGTSRIFEIALVANPDVGEYVFSRTNFTPILQDPSWNLGVTWKVRILV